jgi:predicted nucleotidyltransferase
MSVSFLNFDLMLHPFIQSNLTSIQSLMRQHRIVRAYIFGSAVNTGFSETSDIDLLVDVDDGIDPAELGSHLWDLQFSLESMLGRKVDLLTSRSLKNPFFIKQVEATKELIYG